MTTQLLPPPGEFRTTQEIRDANFAARLRRRRKRMFWWSLPIVVIAFLAAVKLTSAVIINTAGISAYGNENHHTAANRFGHLEVVNIVEPWKPHFNAGTAIYATGDFFGATVPLEEALDRVPKTPEEEPRGADECMVRTNYSLSLEGLGDEAMTAENPGTALDYYDQAQEMLADCAESGEGGEEAQEAEERQQDSQEQAQEQQDQQEQDQQDEQDSGGQEDDAEDDEDSGGEDGREEEQDDQEDSEDDQEGEDEDQNGEGDQQDEERDPREEELEERNQEAQEERERQEQQDGGGDGSGQNW